MAVRAVDLKHLGGMVGMSRLNRGKSFLQINVPFASGHVRVYQSGKCAAVGNESPLNVRRTVIRPFKEMLRRCGSRLRVMKPYRLTLSHGEFHVSPDRPCTIDRDGVASMAGITATYNPDVSPLVVIRLLAPPCTVTVGLGGAARVMGAVDGKDSERAANTVRTLIAEHIEF